MKEKKINSLYLHIPFCQHLCEYCDFTKLYYREDWADQYLDHLFIEIDQYQLEKLHTIYIGGGTPTALNEAQLKRLLEKVSPFFDGEGEFTCEANPENLTEEKLAILKRYGVNRLSIGLQTANNQRLKEIGRHHHYEDVLTCVQNARKHGFNNINLDLMYGFPNETINELKRDLDSILLLNVPHVSIYSLIVEPGSLFYNKNIREQNQDDSRLFYDYILSFMREHGFNRYEISNFAKPGFESKHNLTYWHNEEYYGVGLGASGYINNIRYTNTKSLKSYLEDNFIQEKEEINLKLKKEYFLITNLRLSKGFSLTQYKKEFKEDFLQVHQKKIDEFIERKLAKIEDDYFMFSDDGLMVMDRLILELI